MNDEYKTYDIKKMAAYLKRRKEIRTPTILFLGSRASRLFRSGFLYDILNPFHTGGISRVSSVHRFAACFHILKTLGQKERDEIIRTASGQENGGDADFYIAQLAKRGFFKRLVTTDIATTLESAFASAGMKEGLDFDVFPGRSNVLKGSTRHTGRETLFTFIKYFGDLAPDDSLTVNDTLPLELQESLGQRLNDMRDWDILIVGFDPVWDQHIMSGLFPRNGKVWYVNEEHPSENSFLDHHLQKCEAGYTLGSQGQYERFFLNLCNQIGASEPHHPISKSGPLATIEDTEQTVSLQRSLVAQVQAVLRKEQSPPTSLTVTAHRLYSSLPSGVSAYYDLQMMPLIRYEIKNGATETVTLVLAAEIQGFSDPCIDTLVIPAQSLHIFHYQLPRLDQSRVSHLTKTTPASIHIRINYLKDGVELLYNTQDFPVNLTARNVIRWVAPDIDRRGGQRPLFNHIAAWVTPDKGAVKAMLHQATDYHPQKALHGYPLKPNPEAVRSQVKAIFKALKKVAKIAFVDSRFVVGSGNDDRLQKIRLPEESLREQQANCIDGAVLYASLLESASLQPVIVIQTRYAFVGWKTSKDAHSYEFLDTTMTLNHSFEDACAKGMETYRYLQENGLFDREPFDSRDFARLLDIKELRDLGLSPMD